KMVIDVDHIKLEKKEGGKIEDTELVKGIVIDKERMHSSMPRKVEKSKIVLFTSPLEIKKTEAEAKIKITDPAQLNAFRDEEKNMPRKMVQKINAAGANVVFCQKGIDNMAQHYLSKEGIFAVQRVKMSDIEKLSRATGATIITNLGDLTKKDLGYAGIVEEVKIGDDIMTFVKDCRNPKSVTILIRGSTEHVVAEVARALEDCLRVVTATIRDKKILSGGGAPEIEIAEKLRGYAKSVHGREQLAIKAFADSVEVILRTLAENAGLNPVDILVDLRSAHEDKGEGWMMGLDTRDGIIKNMLKAGVVEPLKVKDQVLDSASEAANMILRIDDVIASKAEIPGAPEQGGE
ncbi:MAG: thermosome subunit alpha, partial [Candidatus Hydrothermarchaeales archaeon]